MKKLILSLFLLPLPLFAYPTNLLSNSSFELGTGRGWITWGNGGGAYNGNSNDITGLITNITGAPDGTHALSLTPGSKVLNDQGMYMLAGTYGVAYSARRTAGTGTGVFGAGILNGQQFDTLYPYLPQVTLPNSGAWVRITNTFTASSNAWYWFAAVGSSSSGTYANTDPMVLIDAIQVITNTVTTYAPIPCEMAINWGVTNDIFFTGDTKQAILNIWNSGTASNIIAEVRVHENCYNRMAINTNYVIPLAAGGLTSYTLPLNTLSNGSYRLMTWIRGVPNSTDEAQTAIYPFAVDVSATTDNDWLGGEPNASPYSSNLEMKKNRKWFRCLSAAHAFRWEILEPTTNNYDWADADQTLADLMVGGRKGIIPLTAGDGTWCPWATNADGTANMNAYGFYVSNVVRRCFTTLGYSTSSIWFEIWNEPQQSGPFTPTQPITITGNCGSGHDCDPTGTNYTRIVHTAIQFGTNANPNVKFIIFGGSMGNVAWTYAVWTNITAQERAYIVAGSTHPYAVNGDDPNNRPNGDQDLSENWFTLYKGILPIMVSETGWYNASQLKGINNLFPLYFPYWQQFTHEADRDEIYFRSRVETMRGMDVVLNWIGNGAIRYMYYDARQWNEGSFAGSQPYAADQLWVDNPDKVALTVASKKIAAPGIGKITNSIANIFMFTNYVNQPVLAAWSYFKTNVSITVATGEFAAYDVYWNQVRTNVKSFVVGNIPTYFTSTTMTLNQMSNDFYNATITAAPDTDAPQISFDIFPTAALDGNTNAFLVRWSVIDDCYYNWTLRIDPFTTAINVTTSYNLDGAGWSAPSTSNHLWLANMSAGSHRLLVRATDAVNNSRVEGFNFDGSPLPGNSTNRTATFRANK